MPVPDLHRRLEELDAIIDPAHVAESERLIEDAMSYREVSGLPAIDNTALDGWPTFPYSEAFHDMEKMLVNELAGVYVGARLRDDRMYTIRANYGVGTVASMFGCRISLTMNNMPWCEALSDTELREALDRGVPDIETAGLGPRVLDTERFYLKALTQHPNLSKAVRVFICDTQGPFDIAHLVMGHRIYTEMYDDPDLVHRLLDLATQTYSRFTHRQKEIISEGNDWSFHSMMKVRGGIRICEDAPTNISGAGYLEFCRPYNERILAEFGGGWIHYCGAGHQIMPHILDTPGVHGINFGNPDMQDLDAVYDLAGERGIGIISWSLPLTDENREHIHTGVSLIQKGGRVPIRVL